MRLILRTVRLPIVTLIAALTLFCTGQTTKPKDARYYPLALGNVWTYNVHRVSPKAHDSMVVWRVTHAGETYQVWPKPMQSDDEGIELAVSGEGIKEISINTFIIKFPIRANETWTAGQPKDGHRSRTFRVLSASKPCSAGNLKIPDCTTIEDDDASASGLRIVTTYGRDLGPVLYLYYRKTHGKQLLVQTVTLTSYKFTGR